MSSHIRRAFLGLVTTASFLTTSCSSKTLPTVCDKVESLSAAVGTLRAGVDFLGDQVAGDLDTSISDGLVVLDSLAVEAPSGVAEKISELKPQLVAAQNAFDKIDWDMTAAQSDPTVTAVVDGFRKDDTVAALTTVNNYVNGICTTGDTLDPTNDGLGTLPTPTIPVAPVTDPPTGQPDNGSDARALGYEIAQSYGITATDAELVCLGTRMLDFADSGGGSASEADNVAALQGAIDTCGILFTVPAG